MAKLSTRSAAVVGDIVDTAIMWIDDATSASSYKAAWLTIRTKLEDYFVTKATFDANTILAATTDNTPAALTVAEQTLVGRITGGNIAALTAAQVRTLLGVDAASVNVQSGTSYTIQTSDAGKVVVFTNGASIAVTLPDTLDDYFQFTVVQAGAGVPTVTRSGSDTINGAATGVTPSAQWKGMYLCQYSSGAWLALL